jgi:hypothetical protein
LRAQIRKRRDAELTTITLPIADVESMLIECQAFRNRYDAASRRQKDGVLARKQIPPRITLENVDRNDSHQAAPEPAELTMYALPGLTSLHDEDRRRLKVTKPTRVVRSMYVSVAVETERPEITVWLTCQPFIRAVMQVDLPVPPHAEQRRWWIA